MNHLTCKELVLVELGPILHPVEWDVEPGEFCRDGAPRPLSMAEYRLWEERRILPVGCNIPKIPAPLFVDRPRGG